MCMRSPEDKKIRTADGGADGKYGESSRIACIGEYQQWRETYVVCEPRLCHRHQYQEMRGDGEKTSTADKREF
jgi:hypothetical protein